MSNTTTLYSDQDATRTKAAIRKSLIILCILIAITLAILITALVVRIQALAAIGTIIGAWLSYFYFSTQLLPWMKYNNFLRDMGEGLSRESDGWFVGYSDESRIVDGVAVHDFLMRVGDDEEDERLFLWDDDKALPQLAAGDKIHLTSFSNFIKVLSVAD